MVLEHYKTELELAQYVSKLEAQVKGYKALCERLQAQADEMRGGRAITSAAQLAELIDGVRCFHDLGAELIAEAVFEQLPAETKLYADPIAQGGHTKEQEA